MKLIRACPFPLMNEEVMQRKWLNPGAKYGFESYHLNFVELEKTLRQPRDLISEKS